MYALGGSEVVTKFSAAELHGTWRWDSEDLYTEELSRRSLSGVLARRRRQLLGPGGRDED